MAVSKEMGALKVTPPDPSPDPPAPSSDSSLPVVGVKEPTLRLLGFVFLACFGAAYFGYTSGVIGGCIVLPSFQIAFNLPPSGTKEFNAIASNIVSSIYIGTLVGCMAIIPVSERFGPRVGLAVSAGIYTLGSALQTWSKGSLMMMYVGRAIAGLGMGGSTSVAPM